MRSATFLLLLTGAAIPEQVTAAPGVEAECAGLLPPQRPPSASRPLVPEDLVRLRDIGPSDIAGRTGPIFTLSPDGRRAAFQLRRADPVRNSYCLAMVVMDVAPGAAPRIVDSGGELLRVAIDIRGKADYPTGIPLTVTPRWSPDGRWIAFLKRWKGSTQVWRADVEGGGSLPLTRSASDVVDFRIGADGSTIIYATRPGLQRARKAASVESLSGFHYDDRFAPVASNRPFPAVPVTREAAVLDLATGKTRAAMRSEAEAIGASILEDAGQDLRQGRPTGEDLWISEAALTGGAAPGALHAEPTNGKIATCTAAACQGASDPWWSPDRRRVRFLRREGWTLASIGIYEWDLGSGRVRRLYLTEDVLSDCAPSGNALICLREASLQPRRLERLDLVAGRRELLFDPNPEFRSLQLGQVERLHWRNAFGLESLGDLVLPLGYRPGTLYPMIVVQYDTRGFLRGGTGDEYPIQAFANRGFAVLSMRRPLPFALVRGARNFQEANRLNLEGFADRRSALSAIEVGVGLAVSRRIADPKRIGITGLSDGATQVISALIHRSTLFSAAAMSSCCFDTTLPARVGPAAAREFHATGYPRMTDRNEAFWNELSLSLNARRIRTPTLLQLADDEYMSALESFTALREVGAPFDMFVFADEHHVKWQPVHRLAVYRRSIDWFDYWLNGVTSKDPDRQAELRHWASLRPQQVSGRRE